MASASKSKFDLTQGPILNTMMIYAIPILVSALIQYLYNVFDTAMVGKWLGDVQMGAVNASGTTSGLLYSLIGGLTMGMAVIIGINFGSGDEKKTLASIVTYEKLCVIAGVLFTVLGLLAVDPLIKITKVPPESVGYCKTYITVLMSCAFISVMNNTHLNLLRTLGDSRSPVIMLVASAIVNVVLNLVFMLVFNMGVFGVAVATVLSQLVSASVAVILFFRHYPQYNFFKVKAESGGMGMVLSEIKMGIPMAFQQSMIMLGAVIVQTKVNDMGSSVMAAYATSNSINNVTSTIINTFGSVISGFVAQNYGARKFDRIKSGMKTITAFSYLLSAVMGIILILFTRPIVSLFLKEWNETLFIDVRNFIYINVAFYIIWVPVPILRCAIQGMKNSLLPFISCLVELPARCVAAWVLGEHFGFLGLSFTIPCALVAAFLFLIVAFGVQWKIKTKDKYDQEEIQNGL